jgi:hypothetical protein
MVVVVPSKTASAPAEVAPSSSSVVMVMVRHF